MTDQKTPRATRGPATKLTRLEKRRVLLQLKTAALAGDIAASAALLNHELTEVTRQRMNLDRATA